MAAAMTTAVAVAVTVVALVAGFVGHGRPARSSASGSVNAPL
jgi:hypothetical protein